MNVKIFSRIAAVLTTAFVSLFVAAPALAADGEHGERHSSSDAFSSAGDPVHVTAILIVGAVLLVVVLATAAWLTDLTEKKNA